MGALDEGIGTDPLQFMLDLQLKLHERLSRDPDLGWYNAAMNQTAVFRARGVQRPSLSQRTLLLIDNAVMLAVEAHEVLGELPWKKHKRDYCRAITDEEREKILEEAIDCQHFLNNLYLLLDVDSREVARRYASKSKVNHARQDGGY